MKKIILTIVILINMGYSQNIPKREFRAVWVATAYGLDFPRANQSTSAMLNEISSMLDSLKNNGFNAVIFQVRPGCDAFYNSAYEPWSHHLTGTSGAAPSPYFDPLQVWVEQAHARNMELHAWFNPYRVSTSGNLSSLHSSHVYHQHPEWLLTVGNMAGAEQEDPMSDPLSGSRDLRESIILDPGKAAVRDYVTDVFMDVVNNYDVDGIHMDDYFYPYGGMSGEDAATFSAESRGFSDINNWRRDNVNLLVEAVFDSIQVVKPWVKWGVSPFGIWKNGVPAGIVGTSSYYELFCDPIAWLEAGTIDYLTPQLYWEHGGGQDYGILMPWWAGQASSNNRHLYPGHAPYRMTDWHNWPAAELPRQVRLNRVTPGCQGSVYFRLRSGVVNNPKGFLDSLDNDLYRYPALLPTMAWKDDIPPLPPSSVLLDLTDGAEISWTAPQVATDGDTAYQYVIYASDVSPVDIEVSANIVKILSTEYSSYSLPGGAGENVAITSLDRLGNESPPVQLTPTSIESAEMPNSALLLSNYPNPFNPQTTIRFHLPEASQIQLSIFDVSGREISALSTGIRSAGSHELIWQPENVGDGSATSGIYFCRLQTETSTRSIKLLYLE